MRGLSILLSAPLASLLISLPLASGLEWHTETVDPNAGVQSLALDSLNRPHMAYSTDFIEDLNYAYKEGNTWYIETIESSPGRQVHMVSLALDSFDDPHIGYETRSEVWYIHREGGSWEVQRVDSGGTDVSDLSLALDSFDLPHIGYCFAVADCSFSRWELRYARWDGLAWEIETVDSNMAESASLALDSQDHPSIAYDDLPNAILTYAHRDGSGWHFEVVDTTAGWVSGISLALDRLDRPHIGYDQTYRLKYACWDGSTWHIDTIENAGWMIGHGVSLALDSLERPHIAYSEWVPVGDLKYAYWDGVGWQVEDVDTAGNVGGLPSLALDSWNFPHIGYSRGHPGGNGVKYAWKGELGVAKGVVAYLHNGQPIEGARVRADGYCDTTEAGGSYSMDVFPRTYDMTASASGCNPDSIGGVVVSPGDTVVVNFYLARPLISVEPSSFRVELAEEDSCDTTLYISNPGDGPLEFDIEIWTGGPPSWLTANPTSGRVGPGETLRDTIGFKTTGLDTGLYAGELRLHNNSADSLVTVPCTLHVLCVGVEEAGSERSGPRTFALHQNSPNPTTGRTSIRFQLPRRSSATLKVYSLTGELVASLVDGLMEPGFYTVTWDGRDSSGRPVAPGLYFYRLTACPAPQSRGLKDRGKAQGRGKQPVVPALSGAEGNELEGSRGVGPWTLARKMVLLR